MFNRSELKAAAKGQIKGNIGILFLCTIAMSLLAWTGILMPALTVGMIMIYLNLTKNQKPAIGDAYKGFSVFGKALWLTILTGFFTCLWSMLLVVPGIIKMLSYSMAPYILAENPEMTAKEALNESKKITEGHKKDLFVLSLSFFFWYMLVGVTFGIAIIYVAPYMQATMANAYLSIKGQAQNA